MVSVIIPLYNKAPYVRKALESVMSQTFRDYECIVVDDGSTDGSAEVVKWFTVNDSRFTIICQENAGVAAARNRGIRESRGEYVTFLDADDWWEPTFLEDMVHFAEGYPEAGLWACNYWYYKPGKTHVAVKTETGYFNYPELYYHQDAMPIWTGATMIRREVLEKVRLGNGDYFPRQIKLGEDFLLWSRIAMKYKVAFLNKPLAYYNNDIPASLRLTRNLHSPESHMLWNMNFLPETGDWKLLKDKLRVGGLLDYWMDKRYHAAAGQQLRLVDWASHPSSFGALYRKPLTLLRFLRAFLRLGSYCKQRIIKHL